MLGVDPRDVSVPVVGGHAGITILPLLSQVLIICWFHHMGMLILKYYLASMTLGADLKPVYLQVTPPSSFTQDETRYLTDRIQNGGTEVVEVQCYLTLLPEVMCNRTPTII